MPRKYETMFVIKPDLEQEKTAQLIDKFKGIIEDNNGEILEIDEWGKRRLAYEIEKIKEGYYVVVKFMAESSVAQELDRVFKITDDIMRHIVIRED